MKGRDTPHRENLLEVQSHYENTKLKKSTRRIDIRSTLVQCESETAGPVVTSHTSPWR